MHQPNEQEAQRRELARSLDCFTSDEFRALASITESTEQAWRKRGTGPAYIRLGTQYFYPRKALAEFMQGRIHERRRVPAKAML
jgi:hypothetical protein